MREAPSGERGLTRSPSDIILNPGLDEKGKPEGE
jgi:hypothetical protein